MMLRGKDGHNASEDVSASDSVESLEQLDVI
jgi:hypothetical protein